jgi:hypothetical protein
VAVIGTFVGRSAITSYEWLESDACRSATAEQRAKGIESDEDVGLCYNPKGAIISDVSSVFGPPLGLLAIGAMIGWVVVGFKRSSTSQ